MYCTYVVRLRLKRFKNYYRRGLVYFDVPIEEKDNVIVPPLEGFVMNRVLGDYLETLLYKIFVSIDENTSVVEVSRIFCNIYVENCKNF